MNLLNPRSQYHLVTWFQSFPKLWLIKLAQHLTWIYSLLSELIHIPPTNVFIDCKQIFHGQSVCSLWLIWMFQSTPPRCLRGLFKFLKMLDYFYLQWWTPLFCILYWLNLLACNFLGQNGSPFLNTTIDEGGGSSVLGIKWMKRGKLTGRGCGWLLVDEHEGWKYL